METINKKIKEQRIIYVISNEIFDRYTEMFKTDINTLHDTELVNNYINLIKTQNEILNKYYKE